MRRIDQIIALYFPEWTRSKIQSLIQREKILWQPKAGQWVPLKKSGLKVDPAGLSRDSFRLVDDEETRYVSRAALKLERAVTEFGIPIEAKTCLDVGLSTGGFTDYLLSHGAGKVLGVDVGRDQLHEKLKSDSRLMFFDKINAREPLPSDLLMSFFVGDPQLFDVIVIDVSFISLSLVIPPMVKNLKTSGVLIALVKPQFELTKKDLNKKGVVKDPSLLSNVLQKIDGVLQSSGLKPEGHCLSPIEGENGNQEVLVVAHKVESDNDSDGVLPISRD